MAERRTVKSEILTRFILELFRVNGRLLVEGDRLMKPLGQTSSRWQVLGSIASAPATVPQIGRTIGISRQSVQRTADLLVADKLCEFVKNPAHQKSPQLILTKQGIRLLGKMSLIQIEWSNQLSAKLSEHEIKTALRVLRSLSI